MLDLISDNADFLIAAANTALDASLVPTVLNQRRDKASTIPLTTSVTSVAFSVIMGRRTTSSGCI